MRTGIHNGERRKRMAEITTTEREWKVRDRQEDILRRAKVLIKNGQIVVTNQEEANFAGELGNEAASLQKYSREHPEKYGPPAEPGEITILDRLHDRRIAAFRKLDTPLGFIATSCKNAANSWRLDEQRRLEEEARRLETQKRNQGDLGFVTPRKKVEVAGLIPMGDRWIAKVYRCDG